jgi:hypothetical protein
MSDNPFFKQQEQKNSHHRPDKSEMQQKCENVLAQIKKYSQERHEECLKSYAAYDRPNVPKKKVLGFYGTLVETLKKLKAESGESLVSQAPPKHSMDPIDLIQHRPVVAETPAQKPVKKVERKANEKPAAKKVVERKAPAKAEKQEKKADKKEEHKPVKKTAKASKAAPAKKAPAKKAAVKKTQAKGKKK